MKRALRWMKMALRSWLWNKTVEVAWVILKRLDCVSLNVYKEGEQDQEHELAIALNFAIGTGEFFYLEYDKKSAKDKAWFCMIGDDLSNGVFASAPEVAIYDALAAYVNARALGTEGPAS